VLKMINRFPVLPLQALLKRIAGLEKRIMAGGGNVVSMQGYSTKKKTVSGPASDEPIERPVKKAHTKPPPTEDTSNDETAPAIDDDDFLDYVRRLDTPLYSHIDPLEKFEVGEDEIILTASEGFVFLDYFKSDEIQTKLRKLSNDFFKRKFKIIVKTVEKKSKNSYKKRSKSKQEQLLDGEHSDPLFLKAREIFEGELIDFRFSEK